MIQATMARKTLDPPQEKSTKGEKNYITPAGYR